MVISLEAERERRKAERHHNPSLSRDIAELIIAGVCLCLALGIATWLMLGQEWR
jgi:hypothetical protein